MDSKRDPRVQIYTNLDDVQKEMEDSAKDRKDEIKSQLKDDKKALKEEMKELKDEVKENFKDIKQEIKDSDEPNSREKINIAKNTRKIIENNIEADYNESIDELERHADKRLSSIDSMLDDSEDVVTSDDRIINDRNIKNRRMDNDCDCTC